MKVVLNTIWRDPVTGVNYAAGAIVEVNKNDGLRLIQEGKGTAYLFTPDPPYQVNWSYENKKWKRIFHQCHTMR